MELELTTGDITIVDINDSTEAGKILDDTVDGAAGGLLEWLHLLTIQTQLDCK